MLFRSVGDRSVNTNLRYKQGRNMNYDRKQVFEVKNPADAGLPRQHLSQTFVFARNDDFFDAPAALFCCVDRQMGPPQWSDLGMYLQTFMLLAVESGLATCPQEYWSVRHRAVTSFLGAPASEMLFCGMAIGYEDREARVNALRTERMPVSDFAVFL